MNLLRVVRVVAGTAGVAAVQVGCAYASAAGAAQVHSSPNQEFSGLGADLAWLAAGAVVAMVGTVVVAMPFFRGRVAHPLLWAVWVPLVEIGALVVLANAGVPSGGIIAGVVAAVAALFVAGTRTRRKAADAVHDPRRGRGQKLRDAPIGFAVLAGFTVLIVLVGTGLGVEGFLGLTGARWNSFQRWGLLVAAVAALACTAGVLVRSRRRGSTSGAPVDFR